MMKVQIQSIHDYSFLLEKLLEQQGLNKEQIAKAKGAYLKIFRDGMDFANGCLKVEIEENR